MFLTIASESSLCIWLTIISCLFWYLSSKIPLVYLNSTKNLKVIIIFNGTNKFWTLFLTFLWVVADRHRPTWPCSSWLVPVRPPVPTAGRTISDGQVVAGPKAKEWHPSVVHGTQSGGKFCWEADRWRTDRFDEGRLWERWGKSCSPSCPGPRYVSTPGIYSSNTGTIIRGARRSYLLLGFDDFFL